MIIEAVTVCVNYADYLADTLPHNIKLFQQVAVVTVPEDAKTREVIAACGAKEVLVPEVFKPFNKGVLINHGLRALARRNWLVQLDADTLCPPDLLQFLSSRVSNTKWVYGLRRFLTDRRENVARFIAGLPLVQPILGPQNKSVPYGFFQLWHAAGAGQRKPPWYPEQFPAANVSDMRFAKKFPKSLVFDHYCLHLGEEIVNWQGRVSPEWK